MKKINLSIQLQKIGFSEKEAQVYLALLKIGPSKVTQISRQTDLNRTSVYDLVEGLIQKGIVSKVKKRGAVIFSALDANHLLSFLDSEKEKFNLQIDAKKNNIQAILPDLLSMHNFLTNKTKAAFFEGEKAMREAYEDTLTSQETILAYANYQTMREGLPYFFPEYFKRRSEKKIFIKAIFPDNSASRELAKRNQKEMRDTRFLPKGAEFTPEINFYNNKMLIVSWREKMAVIIESKELVDLQKLIFSMTWNVL